MKNDAAATILKQLGFWTLAELGAGTRLALEDGLELRLGGEKATRGWRVEIRVGGDDLYRVEAYKLGRKGSASWGMKVDVRSAEGVGCEQLAGVVGRMVFGPRYVARNEAA